MSAREDTLTKLIEPHRCNDRRWCSSCKMMVIDPARHIAEILVAAGVEIKQPSKIKLEEIQARKIPNPKNFTCPTCGAIKGQLCRDTRNFMLKKFHDNRGSD